MATSSIDNQVGNASTAVGLVAAGHHYVFYFSYHHEHHDASRVPWWKLPARRRSAINPEYPEVENG